MVFVRRILFFLVLAVGWAHAAEEFRTWTDNSGRTVEGRVVSAAAEDVVLELKAGGEVTVPILNLSAPDKQWLATRDVEAPETARVAPGDRVYDGPPAETDWPRTVQLKDRPEVEVIKEDRDGKEFIYESDNYEFISDSLLGATAVREFSRVFEATRLVNAVLPLDLQPMPERERKKFRARIFTDEGDYLGAGGLPGSAGVYGQRFESLMLPLKSLGVKMAGTRVTIDYVAEDYGTLIHEITHQMMNHWLGRLPVWYAEGSAEYVELAEYDNARFSFIGQDRRLANHLSLRSGGGKFAMLPLKDLMSMNGATWSAALATPNGAMQNYASALALTYFFYHIDGEGRGDEMKKYLRAVAALEHGKDGAALVDKYLLRGRSYDELQDEVIKGLRRTGVNVVFGEASS